MATNKKVTRVDGVASAPTGQRWTPTAEAKSDAGKKRMLAGLFWVLAIIAQVIGIWYLCKYTPLEGSEKVIMIAILAVDLVFLIIGSFYWKGANRLDPPSRQSALFGIQSQFGVAMAAVCFAPVVIVAFIKKEYLIAGIATALMIGGGAASADYKPASQEEYAQQSSYVTELVGKNHVFWTKSGTKYHLYDDCQYLKSDRTTEIFEGGTVADAYAHNTKIKPEMSSLCSACEKRAAKEKGWSNEQLQNAKDKAIEAAKKGATILTGGDANPTAEEENQ
jgi:hypothetical protein